MTEIRAPTLPLLAAMLLLLGAPAQSGHLETCVGDTCFFLLPGKVDSAGARNVCRGENAELAVPRPAEVQTLRLPSRGRFWIGLTLPADRRCPVSDSTTYGYELVTGGRPAVSGWAGLPDRCDHRCVSVSTDGSWRQEPCGGTLNGSLCAAPSGRCPVGERSAVPGAHNVSVGSLIAQWAPGGTQWTTRREEKSAYFDSKWVCAFGSWWKAPWSCEVLNGGCEEVCVNNTCVCDEGSALHANNVTCVKRNGGVQEKNCAHCEHMQCDRVGGADVCSCHAGFAVSRKDPSRCEPYCDQLSCPAWCPGGGVSCSCPLGYILDEEKRLCVDVDECHHEKPCAQQCDNTLGSYTCRCHAGFVMQGDKCVANKPATAGPSPAPGPVSAPPPTAGVPSYVRVGSVLGMAVFVAVGVALLYLLLRCAVRHSRELELAVLRRAHVDILTLQQVTSEKYQRFSFDKQSWADGQTL